VDDTDAPSAISRPTNRCFACLGGGDQRDPQGNARAQAPESLTPFDTTLTPLRAQYGATQGTAEQRNPLRYGGFARACKLLQRLNYHS
jgi:hypothetical protein